jgi:DNA-binding PadR family transcriptional regulator
VAVLALLQERPMHPYEMAMVLRERAKHESIKLNYGSLYSVVDSLQRHGLIGPVETQRDGRRPERTVYALTAAGRVELFDWLSELLSTPVKEYTQFEAGLSLMGVLPPAEALSLLEERRRLLTMQIRQMKAVNDLAAEQGIAGIFLVESDYVLTLKEAELDWVSRLIEGIASGTLEGLDQWQAFHDAQEAADADAARKEVKETEAQS